MPQSDAGEIFALVKNCGLSKIELRNDMPGGKVADNLSTERPNALAAEDGIKIFTINALGRFNLLEDIRQSIALGQE